MFRQIAIPALWLLIGTAQAADIQDAPIPDPNYLGIFAFLLLFFGSCAWFVWKVMHKEKGDGHDKPGDAK